MEFFTDRRCLGHQAPPGFPERPARLERILRRLGEAGREALDRGDHPRVREAVEAVHDVAYLERFRRATERGDGLLDSADNPLAVDTWEAAWAAAGAALWAADRTLESGGAVFAAVRPPGHHAERSTAMGFCYLNNVAVAAQHLIARHGLARVAVFDFDVHHGNGTQHLFEDRADVLFASTHQFPFYPGTGAAGEIGWGAGTGATVNVPLAAGTGDAGYEQALDERIEPALRDFRPQALLISAGFDAWKGDPVGGMRVGVEGFAAWGRRLGALAAEICDGRLLLTLEGGYDLEMLPELVLATAEGVEEGAG